MRRHYPSKDRNDGLLRLADFRMQRITSRRDHEWKVTVALWALLAAGIAKPHASLGQHWFLFGVGLALLVYGHARWWVMSHWRASRRTPSIRSATQTKPGSY